MRLVLGLGLTYSLVFRGWNGGSVGGKDLIPRRFLLFPRAFDFDELHCVYIACLLSIFAFFHLFLLTVE